MFIYTYSIYEKPFLFSENIMLNATSVVVHKTEV